MQPLRDLVVSQARRGLRPDAVENGAIDSGAAHFELDQGGHALALLGVGDANHGGIPHGSVRPQELLDLGGGATFEPPCTISFSALGV